MKNFVFASIQFAIIALLVACEAIPGTSPGNIAPDFKLKDIEDKTHQLSDYKGKVVMIHLWTDWCNSCRAEFPRIQEYYAELKSDDFELLAINVGQPVSTSKEFQQSFGISFPMLSDPQKIMKDIYKVEAFPTNYFIGPDGKIIRRMIGWLHKKQVQVIIDQNKNKGSKTVQAAK